MDNQKLNTERLIASFENNSSNWVSVYRSERDKIWNYYFTLTGMLNGNYFRFTISNLKVDNVDEIEVSKFTDCKEEIKALLIKFNLV